MFRRAVDLRDPLALLLNLPQQRLVQLKLLAIHFLLRLLGFLLMHLLFQEACVFSIDRLDLIGNTLLFRLVVLFVPRPQNSLLIVVSLQSILTLLLLHHLPRQQITHLFLLPALTILPLLVLFAHTQLPLHFIASQRIILIPLALVLLLDHIASHIVHELLCTTFTSQELSLTVLLHLVQHTHLLILSLNIGIPITFLVFLGFFLV